MRGHGIGPLGRFWGREVESETMMVVGFEFGFGSRSVCSVLAAALVAVGFPLPQLLRFRQTGGSSFQLRRRSWRGRWG